MGLTREGGGIEGVEDEITGSNTERLESIER